MSTIWTPGGEYVPQPEPTPTPEPAREPVGGPGGREPTPDEIEAALGDARAILSVPVEEHLAGHVMGLFELAALQLEREAATGGQEPVDLGEARLAIDALAALVEGLGPRLGRYHTSMTDALAQLRVAYVRAAGPA